MIEIVKGYSEIGEEYHVYVNGKSLSQFKSLEEATEFKFKYEKMLKEKASIASDEQD